MDLFQACSNNDLKALSQALQAGQDPNQPDEIGQTPLIYASYQGNIPIINRLLEAKADPNLASEDGETPLQWAVANNNQEVAQILIRAGANLNAQDRYGMSALHTASCNGRTESVELLIAAKADLNLRNADGQTPLHWASSMGYEDCVIVLLNAGANPKVMDHRSQMPEDVVKSEAILKFLKDAQKEGQVNELTVTGMYFGDAVKTTLKEGEFLSDGLTWEDENGFQVDVENIKDLTHIEQWVPEEVERMNHKMENCL